jgi:hypothetical protein
VAVCERVSVWLCVRECLCGCAGCVCAALPCCTQVTILFSDMVKFTEFSAGMTARNLLRFLNDMFSIFDDLTNELDVYKARRRRAVCVYFEQVPCLLAYFLA